MSVYSKSGSSLSTVYGKSGTALSQAYDINGRELMGGGGEHRDWSKMPQTFVSSMNGALAHIDDYLSNHSGAYAFPAITDVHTYFDYQEPNYIAYNYPDLFSVFLFLGDMTNGYIESQFENAVDYMRGADGQKMLTSVGNHDFGTTDTSNNWVEGDPLPRVWWKPLNVSGCVYVEDDDTLTYYWDDAEHNVRYIMMDSSSTVLKTAGPYYFRNKNLNWLASVLESSGGKDIIVLNHELGSQFYLVTDTEKTDIKTTTGINDIGSFNNIVNAFINRGTISVTVDGVANAHDFSSTTGNFIGFITGHYHNAGYRDWDGFNKWTCCAQTRANYKDTKGVCFFIIDPSVKKVELVIARHLSSDVETYEYSY